MRRFTIHQIHERTGYIVYLVYDEVYQMYRPCKYYSSELAQAAVTALNAPYMPTNATSAPGRSLAA